MHKPQVSIKKSSEIARAWMSKIAFPLLWLIFANLPTTDLYAQTAEVGLGMSLPYYKKETSNDRIILGGKLDFGITYLEHNYFELHSGLSYFAPASNFETVDEFGMNITNKYKKHVIELKTNARGVLSLNGFLS